jgi:hypothetical protein
MWPTIQRHLAWEQRLFRREFGTDKLPLYEAYAAIWASDDLQYNGGGTALYDAIYFACKEKLMGDQPRDKFRRANATADMKGLFNLETQIEFCRAAEKSGIESLLMAFGFTRPDPIALSTALAMHSDRIKFMIACRPGVMSPTVFVQQINTVSALTNGRVYINIVTGHSPQELRYYGDPLEHPQKETYWGHVNPIGPRSVYDESKRFAEAATMAYHRYHKVDTRILRIFNTYGPRLQLNDGRVISNFMKQALRAEPLTVYGDGKQTRSFCYVSDEVDGILRLSRADTHDPVNIGNPNEFTILECAKLVLKVTGSSSSITYEPLPQDDPKQRRPDISKAQRLLGYAPARRTQEGLELAMEWYLREMTKR